MFLGSKAEHNNNAEQITQIRRLMICTNLHLLSRIPDDAAYKHHCNSIQFASTFTLRNTDNSRWMFTDTTRITWLVGWLIDS